VATRYGVQRTINASPERVWELLTDARSYSDWNPAVVSIDGTIAAGEKIKLVSIVSPRTFTLKVAELSPPHRMVWADGMPLGLFKGERTYTLTPVGDGATEFSMVEEFTGPLAPLITKSIPDMTESFDKFADGLKIAAEKP
jgi:hypothetical protein